MVRVKQSARKFNPAKTSESGMQLALASRRQNWAKSPLIRIPSKGKKIEKEIHPGIKQRLKPGQQALREIKYYQKTTELLIPKKSFQKLVREILASYLQRKIQVTALAALQEASEAFMVRFFEDANLCAVHAKRTTLMDKDFLLTARLIGFDYKR